jgi:hypothetical protein
MKEVNAGVSGKNADVRFHPGVSIREQGRPYSSSLFLFGLLLPGRRK